jgi:hypothetical protein
MGAIDCARAILKYVSNYETAVKLVAIAGAESGCRLDATGDRLYRTYSCNGYCSWGPWQINVCAHYSWLKNMAGSSDSCAIARWLTGSYDNSARAAAEVLKRQGLCAWTVYETWCSGWPHNGRYRDFLDEARKAVDAALGEQKPQPTCPPGYIWDPNASRCVPTTPPPVPPPTVPGLPVAVALGAVLLGGAGAGIVVFAYRREIKDGARKLLQRLKV